MTPRRVAFFTDSFHEVNGVALTSREFVAFAKRKSLPMFSVHAGPRNSLAQDDSITTLEFERGGVRWQLEHDLAIDLAFFRYRGWIMKALREFKPDLIHITGPGDAGILGAFFAWHMNLPLAASWHTNLHEFAGRRLSRVMKSFPRGFTSASARFTEGHVLDICLWFYGLAKVLFAPNPELVHMLASHTKRPAFLMTRGIDTELFNPARRNRTDNTFVIGYVGRVSPEKNVRLLATLEQALIAAGVTDYRVLVVGQGSERAWLMRTLRKGEFPGVLKGAPLADAYASMDVLVFPSTTDTFGNVILEAMASGVPAVVSGHGGPKFLVQPDVTGFVANNESEFASAVASLYFNREMRDEMSQRAREEAAKHSWDAVFNEVYQHYDAAFAPRVPAGARSLTFA